MGPIRFAVVAYPHDDSKLSFTMRSIRELRRVLIDTYDVDVPIEPMKLADISPKWPDLVNRVVERSLEEKGCVDTFDLAMLLWGARQPELPDGVKMSDHFWEAKRLPAIDTLFLALDEGCRLSDSTLGSVSRPRFSGEKGLSGSSVP